MAELAKNRATLKTNDKDQEFNNMLKFNFSKALTLTL